VEEIPEALHEAMRQLRTGRPRPVELEIPQDLLAVAADLEVLEPGSYPPPAAEAGDVRAAAELLSGAAHPVIWAGGGVNTSGASEGLRELAELLNAPVLTTPEGKGAISDAHPLAIGLTTAPGAVSAAAQVLPQADVVLAVGTRFAVPPTADWALKESQKLVHLDIDPNELGRVHPPTVGLTGDAGAGLRQLLQALRGREHQGAWDPDALVDLKASIAEQSRQAMSGPYRDIYRDLREVVGEDGIILSGVTGMAYNASGVMPVHKPRTWITSSYMFTLGYEFSTALGAKVGNPDTPVVAIAGDGGFMYSVGELATAVQYGINLVTIVYNNNAFGASINSQRNRRQGRVVGTELHNPDFAALAETFGATGIRVADVADLPAAVGEALAAARPAVVVVEVPTGQTPVQS
jgi:acetolactate synthase-1/2/3 large subunit